MGKKVLLQKSRLKPNHMGKSRKGPRKEGFIPSGIRTVESERKTWVATVRP